MKSIGGIFSLILYTGVFISACSNTQFNTSLKKSYYRVTRYLTKKNHYKPPVNDDSIEMDENNLSMSETKSLDEEMKNTVDSQSLDLEYKDNFSFGKYLEMHWRVEYLEYQLSQRKLV